MLSRTICTTSLMVALCGCAHAPQSYTFTASGPHDGAMNAVAATLKKQGIEPGVIDYRAGTITSRWFDTGYRFREIDDNRPLNFYTDIFLRHHISVSESSGTLNVAAAGATLFLACRNSPNGGHLLRGQSRKNPSQGTAESPDNAEFAGAEARLIATPTRSLWVIRYSALRFELLRRSPRSAIRDVFQQNQ